VAHPYFEEEVMEEALEKRWRKAQLYGPQDVRLDMVTGRFWVQSQATDDLLGYNGNVWFKAMKLSRAVCGCADFHKKFEDKKDEPLLHGVRVCKHVLAAGRWWKVLKEQEG